MRRPIQIRRGTAAEWAAANPILRPGELGLETDTGRIKAAPGRAGVAWNSIRGYVNRAESRSRYAAKSLGGSSGVGEYGSVVLAGTPSAFSIGCVVASTVAHAGLVYVWGRAAASTGGISISSAGVVSALNNTTALASSAAGAVALNGLPHTIDVSYTATTVEIQVNGVLVASATFASVSWNTAGTWRIGASSGGNRWPGSVWNVYYTDHNTAANSRVFLMDEPPTSTTYADSSGNGGASATKGTGAAFPWVTSVASTDGRGMPAQPVGPLVYAVQSTGTQSGVAGTVRIGLTGTEILDPTSSFTGSIFTVPVSGIVTVAASVTAWRTAGSDELLSYQIRKASTTAQGQSVVETITTNRANITITRSFAVTAGETVDFFVTGFIGSTISMENGYMTIELDPTPTTG